MVEKVGELIEPEIRRRNVVLDRERCDDLRRRLTGLIPSRTFGFDDLVFRSCRSIFGVSFFIDFCLDASILLGTRSMSDLG